MYKFYILVDNHRYFLTKKEAKNWLNMSDETISKGFEIKTQYDYNRIRKSIKKEWFYEPFFSKVKRKYNNILNAIKS